MQHPEAAKTSNTLLQNFFVEKMSLVEKYLHVFVEYGKTGNMRGKCQRCRLGVKGSGTMKWFKMQTGLGLH